MKKLLVIGLTILVGVQVSAQVTNCAQTLRLANSTYEQGRLHELPTLLENCLRSGFTPAEQVQAYRLLTLAYIYLEEPNKADESMLKILQIDHYFEINPAVDPAEFVALYNTFRTTPIFRVGIKAGANATQPNVSSYDAASDGTRKYSYKYGFQVGGTFELPVTGRLLLSGELNYASKSFSFHQDGVAGSASQAFSITAVEKQNWVSLPVTVQYYFLNNKTFANKQAKFLPYLSGGFSADYLIKASKLPTKIRGNSLSDVKEETVDVTQQRQRLNMSVLAGVGFKYKISGGYVVGEVRYTYGITKLTGPGDAYTNSALVFNYNMTDGVFRQNSLSLSVGYAYNIFNPIKKKLKK